MLDLVIGAKRDSVVMDTLIARLRELALDGTLYIGYPILSTADETVFVDALLTCTQHGVVVFDVLLDTSSADSPEFWNVIEARQNDLFLSVTTKLVAHKPLRNKRELAFTVNVITYVPERMSPDDDVEVSLAAPPDLRTALADMGPISPEYIKPLNAAIQRVTTIKPPKKRLSVKRTDSKGAILKLIEKEIANLDKWQKSAAIESPESPQRIRGLAGSGKTVVLALKAAYLHARNPEWTIALTFQTRSLYQQFQDMVRRFSYEHSQDEPDWSKLQILHAWGSNSSPGLYSQVAQAHDLQPRDLASARTKYGQKNAFAGVCEELLDQIRHKGPRPLYDAVLIDEAQDFPHSFFRIVLEATRNPKRIVWAYDELQNLSDFTMAPPQELFGTHSDGRPIVELHNRDGRPQEDIILPVCYRNTPWALATAHAIGFGIYRTDGLVQMFDDASLWSKIGYEVHAGQLSPNSEVTLVRNQNATPEYFSQLLKAGDAVQCLVFESREEEAEWVAKSVETNITHDELEASDILIILPDPLTVTRDAATVIEALQRRGIDAHIAGVTSSRDRLFVDNSVAVTGIRRAKGNEASMVYLLDAQHGYSGYELITRRNILFTGITRSRAWVRICGYGSKMERLKEEFDSVVHNNFQLRFKVPDVEELDRIRKIHRDMTPEEQLQARNLEQNLTRALELFETGHIALENLPEELTERLRKLVARDGD